MALIPKNEQHRLQIIAGTLGRDRGHAFEKELAATISKVQWSQADFIDYETNNRVIGNPAVEIIKYIVKTLGLNRIDSIKAYWLGGLATSGLGDVLQMADGTTISRSKTDVLVSLSSRGKQFVKGITVKTCNKNTPTNDQLYFTTASAFAELLRRNGVPFSVDAEVALKMFCGDRGYRPLDQVDVARRLSDPERWFFEELPTKGREDIASTLGQYQDEVTRILLQLAYPGDPLPPEYLMHITVKPIDIDKADLVLFTIDELVRFSSKFAGFHVKEYEIRKGRFKGDPSVHLAPRFGYVQFQRGGQKQHPTQLQFNLMAGYFNHLT